ncbi:iron-sulfur cluster assembly protein [Streptomyces sp. NBC_01622]|uniref:metal-sulfur cluster assembly factor n=1 Tax=Streptomyces sp. NBC_01622 TaxID=2975903 RepID=UPI0038682D69|nr:iron-sulfur cluster assembly protein [Streptomyces sp. NBC_01622]
MPTGTADGDPAVLRAVWAKLGEVLDPCSVHNGTRLSFVDLGMVHGVVVDDTGRAVVRLLLDDPVCIYLVDIMTSVRDAVLGVEGITGVEVDIVGEELWSPDRMTAETTAKMQRWRVVREGRTALPLTPL